MSSKIQALPLPQRQARLRLSGPLAVLATLAVAAGVVGLLILRQGEPAAGPTADAASERAFDGAAIASANFPSVAALEREFGSGISSAYFPSVAALERQLGGAIYSPTFPSVAAMERALALSADSAGFPSVAAMERWINSQSVPDNCRLVRHGPC